MGWTVLYIAFGIVALWLLGEVLLQYKARLRWRLLAFGGFLGVVVGVLIPSVAVIALGTVAFAVGQTYVTLSFRQGFSTGWAIGGRPGASRRRKDESHEPVLEVSGLEETSPGYAAGGPPTLPPEPVYAPEPMPDDTGQYGVYRDSAQDVPPPQPAGQQYGQYDGAFDPYYAQSQPGGQDTAAGQQYDYGTGQQQYTAYSDPYVGGQQYSTYDAYDSFGNQQQAGPDHYYAPAPVDTPPGGVWVPHQREAEPQPPQDPSAPYGYDPAYNEQQQYRY
ncbi:hypothetical protein ACWF94_31305 [Streptomyces sp. NPDC055078]